MPDLPFDVWLDIAEQLTFRRDLLNLSQACRTIRLATICVIFRTVIFSGSGGRSVRTHRQAFAHLCRTRTRVALCARNPVILSAMRCMKIIHASGIYDNIWMTMKMADGGTEITLDYLAARRRDGNPPPPYEDLPTCLRDALNNDLLIVNQELINLIRMAPNLQRVIIFGNDSKRYEPHRRSSLDYEYREGRSCFPSRWGANFRYNNVELDVQGHIRRNDPTQILLPMPRLISMPLFQQSIQHEEEQWFVDLINVIDLPVRSVSFDDGILSRFAPAALIKLQSATHVSVNWFGNSIPPTEVENPWHILTGVDYGQLKGLCSLELSCHYIRGDLPWLRHHNLHHLTSFSGSTRTLDLIIPFAPNLRAIELTDYRVELSQIGVWSIILPSKPMPKVYHLSLWSLLGISEIRRATKIWPSVKELYFPFACDSNLYTSGTNPFSNLHMSGTNPFHNIFCFFSDFVDLEVLHITSTNQHRNSTLNKSTALALNATRRPRCSKLRTITFFDSSVAYWNFLDSVWEFDVGTNSMPNDSLSPDEVSAATAIIGNCYTTWHTSLPKSSLKEEIWSSIKAVFGKEHAYYWEPLPDTSENSSRRIKKKRVWGDLV
ncbi:hypothetical protein M422DRAFT_275441 [Sphaerobolus stellatus SS14]|uniref:F-box domain-containing protein n=1 Tax=Sphaerobolus stellatus (strain SS14) TaxID=990650 RepID=A0A0C9TPP0_SPHS4|nr:hypothetical protein M422DRAFT_275441 [Sphaerobolus stellatus SS14]